MNYYYLVERDYSKPSWAVSEVSNIRKTLPKHFPNPALPPAINSFFSLLPYQKMPLKTQYMSIACKTCGRYDDDAIFDLGFSDPVTIRIKVDFAHTDDRVFAVNQKFLDVLRKGKVEGFETKPLGSSGWHAIRVIERVDCDESVMKLIGPFCKECGRPEQIPGIFTKLEELSLPSRSNVIFTTKTGLAKPYRDRTTFLTEDVVILLKEAGIKGGWCHRLWTREEVDKMDEKAKQGNKWKPKGAVITL